MSYIYGAPYKTRNFVVCVCITYIYTHTYIHTYIHIHTHIYIYIWTYVWQCRKPSLSICCTTFQHWINAESYPVSQLCVNTLLATKVTIITDGILFGWLWWWATWNIGFFFENTLHQQFEVRLSLFSVCTCVQTFRSRLIWSYRSHNTVLYLIW
jgi:hypothetical protein